MADSSNCTRDVGPLSLRASVAPDSLNEEKRTVEITWTTGARVKRGLWEPYLEELSLNPKHVRMDRLRSGSAPLLNSHRRDDVTDVIGVVESAKLEKTRGTATVRFDSGPEGEDVFRKVREGILRNVSVGYRVHKMVKIEDGEDQTPVYRAEDWEPYELSMIPIGADAGAGTRAQQNDPNPCVFVTRAKEKKMADDEETPINPRSPAADPTEQLVEAAKVQQRREKAAEKAAVDKASDEAAQSERKRVGEIIVDCRKHGQSDDLAQKFITAGTPIEKVRELILASLADDAPEINPYHRVEMGEEKGQKFVRGCVAAILERSGHTNTIEEARKVKRLAHNFNHVSLDSGEFGGMRIPDMARHALELRGRSTKGLYGDALIRHALEFRGDSGFNTTSDFAILLETAVNKIFVGQYALTPVTWPLWCGRKSVQDFRTSTFYRPGTFGVLDSVTEAGEVKHKNISDGEKRTLTPGTKGNIIGITRRALVNDDLGAFQNLAAGLGMAAAFTVEADAFALVTANSGLGLSYDANPLFHTSRSNIGPTGAISAATLDGARAVMAKQKEPSANQFLSMRPAVWLGPVELGGIAKQFNSSVTDPTDNKAQGVTNKVLNLFRDIVDSPYLSVSSATRHYLLADPSMFPVFTVGFIDGQESPSITSEQSFGYDGIQMKVILDYGTAVLDYRGAVTCAGA
jgi:HK97 family phage prohead protease